MPARRRRRPGRGLDGPARYAFARYYSECEHSRQLQALCDGLVDRIETLVPEFLALNQAVLHERNLEAFARAWRLDRLLDEYTAGRRRS